jgi:hypothetical protein
LELPVTVAANCWVRKFETLTLPGCTVTRTADCVVVDVLVLLPPPQPQLDNMIDRKNSPMAARVMNVPWGD